MQVRDLRNAEGGSRAYFKAAAALAGGFVAKVKLITVPADTAGDVHKPNREGHGAAGALDMGGSAVKSWAAVSSLEGDLLKAERASAAAANLIRSDLGLPRSPRKPHS